MKEWVQFQGSQFSCYTFFMSDAQEWRGSLINMPIPQCKKNSPLHINFLHLISAFNKSTEVLSAAMNSSLFSLVDVFIMYGKCLLWPTNEYVILLYCKYWCINAYVVVNVEAGQERGHSDNSICSLVVYPILWCPGSSAGRAYRGPAPRCSRPGLQSAHVIPQAVNISMKMPPKHFS